MRLLGAGAAATQAPTSRGGGAGASGRVGVLLLNLGGPDTLADVQPFLYRLFADPDILRLPRPLAGLQPNLASVVSTLRAPKSRAAYESIGGGSPLLQETDAQARALTAALRAQGCEAKTYVGMRYSQPFQEDAMAEIKRDGVEQLVIVPLYPQFSISTSGSSLRLLEEIMKGDAVLAGLQHTVIPSWYQRRGYVCAMANAIERSLQGMGSGEGVRQETEIFFSAHGVPLSYVEEAGDPYKEEMEECVELIMQELRGRGILNHHTLAYQSRVGPVEWLKPYTDDAITRLGRQGQRSLLTVPISFVSENIETLEEIDIEYRELAEKAGIEDWGRVPTLSTDATFIEDLARAVMESLPYTNVLTEDAASLVPRGSINELLDTYDGERLPLPAPEGGLTWGWTKGAETLNGRIAMLTVTIFIAVELLTGRSLFSFF